MRENGLSSLNVKDLQTLLVEEVKKARDRAYAPYSRFHVGCVVACRDEQNERVLVAGCNVENASYGLTICAERVALTRMVVQGCRDPEVLIIYAGTDGYTPPCGACRQVMDELAPMAKVLLLNNRGELYETTTKGLLPLSFNFDAGKKE